MNSRAILAPAAALAALLTVILVAAASGRPALADAPSVDVAPPSAIPAPPPGARALPAPVLDVEILEALRYWTGRPDDVLHPWARAIADGSPSRAAAIWLASEGAVESKFVPWVLDYSCNRGAGWKSCDHGNAVGPFQIWEKLLVDAPPEDHVRVAFEKLHAQGPRAWSTWRAARAQADAWLRQRYTVVYP